MNRAPILPLALSAIVVGLVFATRRRDDVKVSPEPVPTGGEMPGGGDPGVGETTPPPITSPSATYIADLFDRGRQALALAAPGPTTAATQRQVADELTALVNTIYDATAVTPDPVLERHAYEAGRLADDLNAAAWAIEQAGIITAPSAAYIADLFDRGRQALALAAPGTRNPTTVATQRQVAGELTALVNAIYDVTAVTPDPVLERHAYEAGRLADDLNAAARTIEAVETIAIEGNQYLLDFFADRLTIVDVPRVAAVAKDLRALGRTVLADALDERATAIVGLPRVYEEYEGLVRLATINDMPQLDRVAEALRQANRIEDRDRLLRKKKQVFENERTRALQALRFAYSANIENERAAVAALAAAGFPALAAEVNTAIEARRQTAASRNYVCVEPSGCDVRTAPSFGGYGPPLRVLPQGTRISTSGLDGEWARVSFDAPLGERDDGWILSAVLARSNERAA